MSGMGERGTYGPGESFTVTWTLPIEAQEGDMITASDTGITYVFQNGEWRPVTARPEGDQRG